MQHRQQPYGGGYPQPPRGRGVGAIWAALAGIGAFLLGLLLAFLLFRVPSGDGAAGGTGAS